MRAPAYRVDPRAPSHQQWDEMTADERAAVEASLPSEDVAQK